MPLFLIHELMAVLRHYLHCARTIAAFKGMMEGLLDQSVLSAPGAGTFVDRFDVLGAEPAF